MNETTEVLDGIKLMQNTINQSLVKVDSEGARSLLLVVRAEMVAQQKVLQRHEDKFDTPEMDAIQQFKDLTIFQGQVKMAENLVNIISKG